MYLLFSRLIYLLAIGLLLGSCNLEIIPDNFSEGPTGGESINTFEETDQNLGGANSMFVNSGGRMVITGNTEGIAYLRWIDSDGVITMDRTYATANSDFPTDVLQLSDSTIVVVGSTRGSNLSESGALYIRTYQNGDLVGDEPQFILQDGYDFFNVKAAELPDNSVLIVGEARSTTTGNRDIYVACYSPDLSSTCFEDIISLPNNQYVADVIALADGFLVVGYDEPSDGGDERAMMVKFNLAGSPVRDPFYYGSPGGQSFSSITRLENGEILLVGLARGLNGDSDDVLLVRTNTQGITAIGYPKKLGREGINEFILDCKATRDGGIILSGFALSQSRTEFDALLIKIDALDEEEWRRVSTFDMFDMHTKAIPTTDGGYAVCGYRDFKLYYAKTNERGFID